MQPTDENGLFADTDYFIQLFSARHDVCTHRWLSVDSCSASAPSLSADPGKGRPDSGRWRLSQAVAGSSTYYIRPASCPQVDLAFDATCSRPLLSDRADPLAAGRASSQAQAIGKLKASRSASRAAWSFEPAGKYGRFRVTARSCGHKLLSPAPVGWPGASCEAGPMLLVDRENATLGHQLLGTLRLIKVVRVRVRVRVRFRVRVRVGVRVRVRVRVSQLHGTLRLIKVDDDPGIAERYFAQQKPLVLAAARHFVVHPYFARLAKLRVRAKLPHVTNAEPYYGQEQWGGWLDEWSGPLCVEGKRLVAYNSSARADVSYGASDFGGEHKFEVHHVKRDWPHQPHGELLLSWFSCEGNVHHMLGETIYPLWKTIGSGGWPGQATNLSILREKQVHKAIRVAFMNTVQWPPEADGDCHSSRFSSLLALLPIHRELFIGPGRVVELATAGALLGRPAAPPQCFARVRQQMSDTAGAAGLPQAFYQWIANESTGCHPPRSQGGARVLLVRRATTRRIVNEGQVEKVLRNLPQVARLKVVDFARLSAMEQMREVCGAHVMVGVHGQGNEWGHFLNGAKGKGGALLELRYDGWPCYYAPRMEMGDSRIVGVCQEHERVGNATDPKFADVKVNLTLLEEAATSILENRLANLGSSSTREFAHCSSTECSGPPRPVDHKKKTSSNRVKSPAGSDGDGASSAQSPRGRKPKGPEYPAESVADFYHRHPAGDDVGSTMDSYLGQNSRSLRQHERRPSYTHTAAPVLGPRAVDPGGGGEFRPVD